jgi:hypothetical protein
MYSHHLLDSCIFFSPSLSLRHYCNSP